MAAKKHKRRKKKTADRREDRPQINAEDRRSDRRELEDREERCASGTAHLDGFLLDLF
jgi:hypothetical protein